MTFHVNYIVLLEVLGADFSVTTWVEMQTFKSMSSCRSFSQSEWEVEESFLNTI